MAEARAVSQVYPGKGLGWIILGASLHAILTRLKSQPQMFPQIDLSYSSSEPVLQPVVLNLTSNGIRLRFDGPDQRLRLIEVLDFSKTSLSYKNTDLVRRVRSGDGSEEQETSSQGPPFRHVYNRLFGPSYPGEYLPPTAEQSNGTYVLSYPGVAFSFSVKHKVMSAPNSKSDFVSILSSSAASNASSMAIFSGQSWPEIRPTLYTTVPSFPRSLALSSRNTEAVPDEIETIKILGAGRLEVQRRSSQQFAIVLSETTPQDLVAELGPPDAIYRKNDSRISIHANSGGRRQSLSPVGRPHSADTDHSSALSYTEESDNERPSSASGDQSALNPECFYNYFHHGFDALVSFPTTRSPPFPDTPVTDPKQQFVPPADHLVITKILLHANVPGSYPFNRHRRSRWTIVSPDSSPLTSEQPFQVISSSLKSLWRITYASDDEEKSMQRGMVLNRGWGESPESSIELLGGFEGDASQETPRRGKPGMEVGTETIPGMSNTELFGFPGLLFEVLKNDTVSCVTVY